MWDVTKPEEPQFITRVSWDLKDTHKNWWECDTGIAYLVSGVDGWRIRRMTEVFDLSDPTKPVKIRDFGLVGQQPGATGAIPEQSAWRDLARSEGQPHLFRLRHQQGRRAADRRSREALERTEGADAREPSLSGHRRARHDAVQRRAYDLPDDENARSPNYAKDKQGATRDIVMIVDEQIANECNEPRQMVWFVDGRIENKPMVVSNFQVPEATGNFCARGGRFGSHSPNESMAPVFYQEAHLHRLFQRRRARRRHPRSL